MSKEYKNHNNYICKECAQKYEDIEMYAENFFNSRPIRLPLRHKKYMITREFHSEPPEGSKPKLPKKQC